MRDLLLVLCALAAGVAAALLAGAPRDASGLDPLRGTGARADAPPPARGPIEAPTPLAREDAGSGGLASLEVRVVDPRGGPLATAAIRLDDAAGLHEGRGHERFERLAPGPCTLRVSHRDYPTWLRTLALAPGDRAREVVQLRRDLELHGRVTDRFGLPRAGERVWFLRGGQRHPRDDSAAGALLSVVSDRDGRWRATLPEVGRWRVSVGSIGAATLEDAPRELVHGGPDALDIVLPDATLLEVHCRAERSVEPLTLTILERRADARRADPDPGRGDGRGTAPVRPPDKPEDTATRAKRLEAMRARQAAQAARGGAADGGARGAAGAPTGPEWVGRTSRRVPNDGRLRFSDLPAQREYRLSILRGGERRESDSVVVLAPDERVVIELDLPAPSPGGSPVVLPLPLRSRSERLAPDERAAGVHWRE